MGSKDGTVGTTPQQQELLKIAQFQAQRFQQRELPAIKTFAKQVTAAHEPGSFERNRSLGQASAETAAAFGQAEKQADAAAASRGGLGSAAHKLGAVEMGADAATATGLGAVAADQSAEDQYVSGLGRVVAAGRGQQATAVNSASTAADISGQQAQDAAQRSLQNSIGTAGLVGQGIGTAAALWSGSNGVAPNTEDYRGTTLPNSLRGGR